MWYESDATIYPIRNAARPELLALHGHPLRGYPPLFSLPAVSSNYPHQKYSEPRALIPTIVKHALYYLERDTRSGWEWEK